MTLDKGMGAELQEVALRKMSAVLGPERARSIMIRLLHDRGQELHSPDDLFDFAAEMETLGGFEATVGAMLGVTAIMRGASGKRR